MILNRPLHAARRKEAVNTNVESITEALWAVKLQPKRLSVHTVIE